MLIMFNGENEERDNELLSGDLNCNFSLRTFRTNLKYSTY